MISEPGFYEIDEDAYHADPVPESSLSVSGAKILLDCPARFKHYRENPKQSKAFDYGHAAHAKVLGKGNPVVAIPDEILASNGATSTKAAKEFIAEARAAGQVPLKSEDVAQIDAMAAKILEHPITGFLFREGEAEQSAFWRDPDTQVMLRARTDWRTKWHDGRPVIVDYKTTANASPDAFRWDAGKFGYHQQDPWYREVFDALTGEEHLFLFVAQEKTAPYFVTVHELDDAAREIGAQRNRVARRLYLDCMTRDDWPAYPPIVNRLNLPNARYAPEESSDD